MQRTLLTLLLICGGFFTKQTSYAQCISAIELDGVDDYLHTPFNNYSFSTFTIEMWISSTDFSSNDMYVAINQNSLLGVGGWQPDGTFNLYANGLVPGTINSGAGTTPSTVNWHKVVYVYDGTNQIVYIDGFAVNTTPTSGTIQQGNGNNYGMVIGARFDASQQFSNTTFADIRIWNVARSASELSATYGTDLTGNEPGLIAYYRFEDGIGSTTVTDLSGNGNDLTLHNMDPNTDWVPSLFSTDIEYTQVVESCGPFTWVDGNTYTSNNSTAVHTFVGGSSEGCDSIVTLNLTINTPIDATVSTNGNQLTSNEQSAGTQYQWIDCDNGNTPIPAETNQSFTATGVGSYAVIVTGASGCEDTSACEDIQFSGVDEVGKTLNQIGVFPNPTTENIQVSGLEKEENYQILNALGKVVQFGKTDSMIDLSSLLKGVYFLKFEDVQTIKIIKQ